MVVGLSPKGECVINKWFVVLKRKLKFPELCVPHCSLSRRHVLIYQSNKENPNPNTINFFFWIGQHFDCTFPFQILSCFLFIKATSSGPDFVFNLQQVLSKFKALPFSELSSLGRNLGLSPTFLVKFCKALIFSTLSGKYVCFYYLFLLWAGSESPLEFSSFFFLILSCLWNTIL